MTINPNDPAMPHEDLFHGLTIRAYIAARAMQGMLSAREDRSYKRSYDAVAEASVLIADALIKQLNKPV